MKNPEEIYTLHSVEVHNIYTSHCLEVQNIHKAYAERKISQFEFQSQIRAAIYTVEDRLTALAEIQGEKE